MSESRTAVAPRPRPVVRVLFGLVFLLFGLHQLATAGGLGHEGVPPAAFWLVLRGVSMLVVSASIWTNRFTAVLLPTFALLMLVFIVALDLPDALDPETRALSVLAVLKNLLLAGGALVYGAASRRPAVD